MVKRPTISDLAEAADVSISTVNRILGGKQAVRLGTIQRVQDAADRIGFYGLGSIEQHLMKARPSFRLGFLMQQSKRQIYQAMARQVVSAARSRRNETVEPLVDFVDLLTPENIAQRLIALGRECDAVAIIAADHPLIGQAIRTLRDAGKPVVAYISDQSAPDRAAYVGTDNWKLGRTAAYLIDRMTPGAGRIAVYLGNHRYQCQDAADASFRSYIREHAPHLTIEDSRPTGEEPAEAYRMVSDLMDEADDIAGILIVGGGISGVLQALREAPARRRDGIRVICRDIGPEARQGLTEGLITAALCHPLAPMSQTLIDTMIEAINRKEPGGAAQRTVPFDIVTPANI